MARGLKYLILDVDGTLTDGGIYYGDSGYEIKKFHVKDGAGMALARSAGMKIMVMTGRECQATKRRMEELQVDFLFQNVKNKAECLKEFCSDQNVDAKEAAYIGDDLNDLSAMRQVGFAACPADACEEVKRTADYVAALEGGHGAVREIIEYILKQYGEWEALVNKIYG